MDVVHFILGGPGVGEGERVINESEVVNQDHQARGVLMEGH